MCWRCGYCMCAAVAEVRLSCVRCCGDGVPLYVHALCLCVLWLARCAVCAWCGPLCLCLLVLCSVLVGSLGS